MATMTAQEGRDAIRELMARWDYCIAVARGAGLSQAEAEDCVGRYFTRMFGKAA